MRNFNKTNYLNYFTQRKKYMKLIVISIFIIIFLVNFDIRENTIQISFENFIQINLGDFNRNNSRKEIKS